MNQITQWQNSDFFSDLRDKTNLAIDLLDDETIDNIARRLTSDVVRQLVDYTIGIDKVVILWGLELTGSNPGLRSWTEGAIYYEGDIYIIDAGSDTTTGSEVLIFDDITAAGVHEIKEATLINGTVAAGISQDVEGANTTRYNRNSPKIEGSDLINIKVLEINNWNMNTTEYFTVAHGLSDITKIISCSVLIKNDTGDLIRPLEFGKALIEPFVDGRYEIDATDITLRRHEDGGFDDADYADPGLRGYIKIEYLS